jgi:diguanylate cyclase (GGDEF)-like protein/PAS domain S-box-containing protein
LDEAERYRALVESMSALVCRFRPDGVLTYVNRAYCDYFGKTPDDLVGRDFFRFIPSEDRDMVRAKFQSLTPTNPETTYEHKVIDSDGRERWQRWTDRALYAAGELLEYQSFGYDVTEHRKAREELLHLSYQDPLTGIANRRKFEEILSQTWKLGARGKNRLSVIIGDIDFFKAYNDTFGHQAGDNCLRQIAAAFSNAAKRDTDLAARIGGEEFALLLPGSGKDGARKLAEWIRAEVSGLAIESAPAADKSFVTISLGVAGLVPTPGGVPEDLLNQADKALYQSKKEGRDRVTTAG